MNASSSTGRLRRFLPVAVLAAAAWLGISLLRDFGSERVGQALSAEARPGDILMVSSETCVYCAQARAWMQAHRVPFGECVIERDATCSQAYQRMQAPGTPMLVVRGQRQMGFVPELVLQALRQG